MIRVAVGVTMATFAQPAFGKCTYFDSAEEAYETGQVWKDGD